MALLAVTTSGGLIFVHRTQDSEGGTRGSGSSSQRPAVAPRLPDGARPLIEEGRAAPTAGPEGPPAVPVSVESELFPRATGDVADDVAIWRNPERPERSFVLAANKAPDGGVAVYDLAGRTVHYRPEGKIGNIDLRGDYRLGDRNVVLVGANDRTTGSLRFWSLDPESGALAGLEARRLPSVEENYGFCLGRTSDGRHAYAFVSTEEGGTMEQYELRNTGGRIDATKVRTFDVGSQSEGCTVDDARDALYVGEEDVGIWRYDLDPGTGSQRRSIDRVGGGHLVADVEGVSSTRTQGRGVLVVSSQGDSTFAVYDLDGDHPFLGSFQVRRGQRSDGVSETDGLAVQAGDFGPAFPNGLLVVHDGQNHDADDQDERCSNVKFVRFDRVIALTPTA